MAPKEVRGGGAGGEGQGEGEREGEGKGEGHLSVWRYITEYAVTVKGTEEQLFQ